MLSTLVGAAICLAPLLFVAIGYWWGRYGLPVEVRRRRLVDRRGHQAGDDVEVVRYDAAITATAEE